MSMRNRPAAPARDLWRRALPLAASAALGVAALVGPHDGVTYDEHVYRSTVTKMRAGDSYYAATADALEPMYGPPSSVRAIRPPTLFWLWRWVPGGVAGLRVLFLVAAGVAAALASRVAGRVAPGAVVWAWALAAGGVLPGEVEQFLLAELWALPLVFGAWVAWRSGRDTLAAALAVAATACREFAVLLVLGGLVGSYVDRDRRRAPWVVAGVVVAGLGIAHAVAAADVLTDSGYESPLLGTGFNVAERFARMAGFGLPARLVAGPALFGLALWACWRTRSWFVVPLTALPAAAAFADRPYWGALVVPVALTAVAAALRSGTGEVALRP